MTTDTFPAVRCEAIRTIASCLSNIKTIPVRLKLVYLVFPLVCLAVGMVTQSVEHQACDSCVACSTLSWAPLHSNFWQVTYT